MKSLEKHTEKEKSTALSIPRQSPIQVLTGLYVAYMRWSDDNRMFQRDMAVDNFECITLWYKSI